MQVSQQPAPDGENQVKKRRQRRKPRASVSAIQGPSMPAVAPAATVRVSSGQVGPTAGQKEAGKRPQTLPHATAVVAGTSVLPRPTAQIAVPKDRSRWRSRSQRTNATPAVADGVSQGAPLTTHFLQQSINHRLNPAISQSGHRSESATEPLTPEEKAARKRETRLQKLKRKEDHLNLVFSAANATVDALDRHGLSCAVFGSLACKLYGSFRDPKDVDVLIIQPTDTPSRTAEQVKTLIVDTNPRHFFLKLPRDPTAPYRKLYYRSVTPRGECKIDILTPGTMYLPDFSLPSPHKHITTVSGIPLVPFSLLLLHKLQGWSDHINSPEEHKRRRHVQDAADVRRLLAMEARLDNLRQAPPWSDLELFCEEFRQLTRERVKEYCRAFPNRAAAWELLGFETSSEASSDLAEPCLAE